MQHEGTRPPNIFNALFVTPYVRGIEHRLLKVYYTRRFSKGFLLCVFFEVYRMLRISTHYKLYEENETWYGFKGCPKINTIKAAIRASRGAATPPK